MRRQSLERMQMPLAKYRYLVVEGPSRGQDQPRRRLAQHLGASTLLEKPDENPFLNQPFRETTRRKGGDSMLFDRRGVRDGRIPGGGAGGLMGLLPILLMFVIFYFLLIRPQQKDGPEAPGLHQEPQVGDRVVTTGGLHGEVKGLTETTVTLEVAEKVRVKVTRSAISGSSQEAATPEAQKPA